MLRGPLPARPPSAALRPPSRRALPALPRPAPVFSRAPVTQAQAGFSKKVKGEAEREGRGEGRPDVEPVIHAPTSHVAMTGAVRWASLGLLSKERRGCLACWLGRGVKQQPPQLLHSQPNFSTPKNYIVYLPFVNCSSEPERLSLLVGEVIVVTWQLISTRKVKVNFRTQMLWPLYR